MVTRLLVLLGCMACGGCVQGDDQMQIVFRTTMGPTLFTVSQPAVDGTTTIVPHMDDSASLTFAKASVRSMIATGSITVKETGKENPTGATCEFLTAGPISGVPTCSVSFSMITMHCTCDNLPKPAVAVVEAPAPQDGELKVLFKTTMGPTLFTVTEPAVDGTTTILPQFDDSASLTFAKESVRSMVTLGSITVKETGKENPKTAACDFPMAGPITGVPTCTVSFSLITMHCSCDNFPRTEASLVFL